MEKENLNNSTIIRNISTDQSEILHNIMELYTGGQPFDCDMTASTLSFYRKSNGEKYEIPKPRLLFDVYPQGEGQVKITPFERLPLADGEIKSIVVDLPFVVSPKTSQSVVNKKDGSNIIFKRFASWYPVQEFYENAYWWINECYRVLGEGGICVWKMQNTVSGGISHWFTPFSMLCAQDAGFYVIDEFQLEAKNRLISAGKYKKQVHARKYTSTFFVFAKDGKKAEKTDIMRILKGCKEQDLEHKVWEIK